LEKYFQNKIPGGETWRFDVDMEIIGQLHGVETVFIQYARTIANGNTFSVFGEPIGFAKRNVEALVKKYKEHKMLDPISAQAVELLIGGLLFIVGNTIWWICGKWLDIEHTYPSWRYRITKRIMVIGYIVGSTAVMLGIWGLFIIIPNKLISIFPNNPFVILISVTLILLTMIGAIIVGVRTGIRTAKYMYTYQLPTRS
jgi:hypothetical protein